MQFSNRTTYLTYAEDLDQMETVVKNELFQSFTHTISDNGDTYVSYNSASKRLEMVVKDILIQSFIHTSEETGEVYFTFNEPDFRLEYYCGGVLVRSFEHPLVSSSSSSTSSSSSSSTSSSSSSMSSSSSSSSMSSSSSSSNSSSSSSSTATCDICGGLPNTIEVTFTGITWCAGEDVGNVNTTFALEYDAVASACMNGLGGGNPVTNACAWYNWNAIDTYDVTVLRWEQFSQVFMWIQIAKLNICGADFGVSSHGVFNGTDGSGTINVTCENQGDSWNNNNTSGNCGLSAQQGWGGSAIVNFSP